MYQNNVTLGYKMLCSNMLVSIIAYVHMAMNICTRVSQFKKVKESVKQFKTGMSGVLDIRIKHFKFLYFERIVLFGLSAFVCILIVYLICCKYV